MALSDVRLCSVFSRASTWRTTVAPISIRTEAKTETPKSTPKGRLRPTSTLSPSPNPPIETWTLMLIGTNGSIAKIAKTGTIGTTGGGGTTIGNRGDVDTKIETIDTVEIETGTATGTEIEIGIETATEITSVVVGAPQDPKTTTTTPITIEKGLTNEIAPEIGIGRGTAIGTETGIETATDGGEIEETAAPRRMQELLHHRHYLIGIVDVGL